MASASGTNSGWPPGTIPIEIFVLIAENLDHVDLQNLRLVNKEFNDKLLCYLYRQLVIHLSPELKTRLDSGLLTNGSTSTDIADDLSRSPVFKYLGPSIRRLGLALELSEEELASPDIEDEMEIHCFPCRNEADEEQLVGGPVVYYNYDENDVQGKKIRPFLWRGAYRWPRRLNDQPSLPLGEVTTSLESSQGISRILGSVENVRELALSCEGGLGYLQGPDINPFQPPCPPPVFGSPNTARVTPDFSTQAGLPIRDLPIPYTLERLYQSFADLGIEEKDYNRQASDIYRREGIERDDFAHDGRTNTPLPACRYPYQVTRKTYNSRNARTRLMPDALTKTQVRFLYQHVSAQQALVQSFLLALLDKGPRLADLTKLNISRLPSSHIDLLCRTELWSALPRLEEVALGIVPDWRSVSKLDNVTVGVIQVFPTDALPKVYRLLKDYIGECQNITRLHFEWICGGELAPGCAQRDRHVLPAPFLKNHRKVILSSWDNLLFLKHIAHLSLKNCWFAPNVFYRLILRMAKEHSLTSLELETVSLSGPPNSRMNPAFSMDKGMGIIVEGTRTPPDTTEAVDLPLKWSWAHIIDMLTPGPTVKEHLHELKHGPWAPKLRIKKELKLRKLAFKSCGYVYVYDVRFISNSRFEDLYDALNPPKENAAGESKEALEKVLQVSTDRHLAIVVPKLDGWESDVLRQVFGFSTGWTGVYDAGMIRAAQEDGIEVPGNGRFTGTIEHDPPKPDEDGEPYTCSPVGSLDYNDTPELNRLLKMLEGWHDYPPRPTGDGRGDT